GFDLHAGLVVPAGPAPGPPPRVFQRGGVGAGAARARVPLCVASARDAGAAPPDRVFDPVEFLGRLAVLVPRPRINLILYHGVLRPGRPGGLRWFGARQQRMVAMPG